MLKNVHEQVMKSFRFIGGGDTYFDTFLHFKKIYVSQMKNQYYNEHVYCFFYRERYCDCDYV